MNKKMTEQAAPTIATVKKALYLVMFFVMGNRTAIESTSPTIKPTPTRVAALPIESL